MSDQSESLSHHHAPAGISVLNRALCVAPMMDWTNSCCRVFHRHLAPSALLYTEMITTGAILFGDRARFLAYNPVEQPLAVQLGGSQPTELAQCARIAESEGYQEVNLNVGCPSDRVQNGQFGACLMLQPSRVADCVAAMCSTVNITVTVKCRIGVDDQDSEQDLDQFIDTVGSAGCTVFIVHARKAWLQGLSPKENREIPPLDYSRVERLQQKFPDYTFVLNGGIRTTADWQWSADTFSGSMLGRAAYQTPYVLHEIQSMLDGKTTRSRLALIQDFVPHIDGYLRSGGRLHHYTRHMLGMFHGQPGGKIWRRLLSTHAVAEDAGIAVIEDALQQVVQAQHDVKAFQEQARA